MRIHCTQPNQVLDMLKLQHELLNQLLAKQNTQEKIMNKIALTQTVVISDIKELKKPTQKSSPATPVLTVSPPMATPSETLAPPDSSAPALQSHPATFADIVQQSSSEQRPQVQHELQSCASSILFMGDSIFRNVYMEKIEKQAKAKVTVVKAYSSVYDNNKKNKFKSSNFTDLVPKELNKAKYDSLVIQASSTDLTNYKSETNKEKQRQIAQTSNANMLSVATTATANHPEVKKVVVFERVPRFDELQELNEFANSDLHAQWLQCDKQYRDKISIGKHNLLPQGRFANVQRLSRWGDRRSHQKSDNLHMRGPSGMMKMTDRVLAVLARTGVIEEAGPTGYFREKTDKSQSSAQSSNTQSSNPQSWQQAGGRRRGRAPRRRQEEPFELPLSNRYRPGNC